MAASRSVSLGLSKREAPKIAPFVFSVEDAEIRHKIGAVVATTDKNFIVYALKIFDLAGVSKI
jgi:hypothetical protein